jgi:hypothetical protein
MNWRMASGFTLAAFPQRKMALNDCRSPDPLNVRRQPAKGWRPTSSSWFMEYIFK